MDSAYFINLGIKQVVTSQKERLDKLKKKKSMFSDFIKKTDGKLDETEAENLLKTLNNL